MNTKGWSPLLHGTECEEALAAVIDIADALRDERHFVDNSSLASGAAGIASFYAYAAEAFPERGYDADAAKHLDRAMEMVGQQKGIGPGLYSGFTGVAWTIEHLTGSLLEEGDEDPCVDIDEALGVYLGTTRKVWDYDLINGLVGCGVYALERSKKGAWAAGCLERIVTLLEESSMETPQGITWHTSPSLLRMRERRDAFPEGYFNVGLAHGVPAVIGLLGAIHGAGISPSRTGALLDGAVTWLLAQELPGDRGSLTTTLFDARSPRVPSRQAWCYGDPGVAAALFVAGVAVGRTSLCDQALRIARFAAAQPEERSGVVDAGLCHGAAGLLHIYHRLYRASGDESLADAARSWAKRTLAMRTNGAGVAGYRAFEPSSTGDKPLPTNWTANPGLLTGAAGIGLALLSAAAPIEPGWDRSLLLSVSDHGKNTN